MRMKTFLLVYFFFCCAVAGADSSGRVSDVTGGQEKDSLKSRHFRIQVVDEQTGRGVGLVMLTTTNHLSFTTDSNGIAAIHEPGLMNQKVFFYISSHGYEYPKDGFGFSGRVVEVEPGGSVTFKIKRLNIAERLYRVTGQGIYRDSVITGDVVPLANPVINGLVMGQDSVQTCWYKDKLYWFWGDTGKPSYPLGHFAMAGAVSLLPAQGGLDPSKGIDLHYFIDEAGFSKKMAPMSEPGMIWLDGFFTVEDSAGKQHMLAIFARVKSLAEVSERGLMHYNEETELFMPIIRGGPEFLLYNAAGHPLGIKNGENRYYYFATDFPLSVRMRIKASWESATNPNEYEVFTALNDPDRHSGKHSESKFRWISSGELLEVWKSKKSELIKALQKEKECNSLIYDIETGSVVKPHGGSVYWNKYRRKWIMITVQSGGESSYLGEVWYAEADTPLGPWAYARKIVTHNSYSFYNPKHHPYFDQDNGRLIYFEGTYTHTFSGRPEDATPRYDYNQIMYRLDLSDKRLNLPGPVYQVRSETGHAQYLMGDGIRRTAGYSKIEKIPFYAIAPDRTYEGLVPIYSQERPAGGQGLTKATPSDSAGPLFYGLIDKSSEDTGGSFIVALFEYTDKETSAKVYSVEDMAKKTWAKAEKPLCYVWKNPTDVMLADWQAEPYVEVY
jgi:hypothetical protein